MVEKRRANLRGMCAGLWGFALGLCVYLIPSAWGQTLSHEQLLDAKASANSDFQRQHAWHIYHSLVTPQDETTEPVFAQWHSEADTFHPSPATKSDRFPGRPVSTRTGTKARSLPGGPLMTFIHFNTSAQQHIRAHHLHQPSTLDRLINLPQDTPADRRVPPLPRQAQIVMTAWWPIDGRKPTPMPVWDPQLSVRPEGANGYLSWPRTVAVIASPDRSVREINTMAFAGRLIEFDETVNIEQFYHLAVDETLANSLMAQQRFRKAAIIALGRPLKVGDFIALVGLHIMTAELDSGVWSTLWWHDQPDRGPFAKGRPKSVASPWDHYLMDVTVDARYPLEADGSPNICFNPWFDATFSNTGEGSGVQSNCVSCHMRAAYPITRGMHVTRGTPPAPLMPGQLPTALLWSVAKANRIYHSYNHPPRTQALKPSITTAELQQTTEEEYPYAR